MDISYVKVNLAMAKQVGHGPAILFGVIVFVCQLPEGRVSASQDTLAKLVGASDRSIRTWLEKLERENLIVISPGNPTNIVEIHPDVTVVDVFEAKKKRQAPSTPKNTSPEIELVRDLYHRYPPKKDWPIYQKELAGKKEEYVRAIHKLWCEQKTSRGVPYNPTNPNWTSWVEEGPPDGLSIDARPKAPVKQAVAVTYGDKELF